MKAHSLISLFSIYALIFFQPAFAGAISSQVVVGCEIIRGTKLETGDCKLLSTANQVTPASTQPHHVADYRIYCPKGEMATITKEPKYYQYTADNQLVKISDTVDAEDAIYTNSECTEIWDPAKKVCYRGAGAGGGGDNNGCYSGSLYCKRTIKDKNNPDKRIIVIEFTINY